ncbi:MAG: DUF1206 domain-containing protein [Acetobacterales bacterium]
MAIPASRSASTSAASSSRLDHFLATAARIGYAARAVVYFLVGGLAMLAALGRGGGSTDSRGALLTLLGTGFGSVLLFIIAVGLVGYVVWHLFQAIMDTDRHGRDAKGLAVRAGLLVSAATHSALAVWAFVTAVTGVSASDDSGGSGGFESWLMQQPYGSWLVAAVGLCIVGAGIAHVVKGATGGYEKWLKAAGEKMNWIRPICSVGLVARGIVFLIIGWLFLYAGMTVSPQEAGGLREAFQWIRELPFGPWLFLLMAIGLVCFGGYSLIQAIYRRVDTEQETARLQDSA